jgi:uncharacterized protein (DUF2236 family)
LSDFFKKKMTSSQERSDCHKVNNHNKKEAINSEVQENVGIDSKAYFPPGSMIRRVTREALGLLGGGRAILLQLAHPLVAAGVAKYSEFQKDTLARLFGTLKLMHTLVFGSRQQADQTLRKFHKMHAVVRGSLAFNAGSYLSGTPYQADDPELMMWVHATLVDTGMVAYERFVSPLRPYQRSQLYADTRILADLMCIPDRLLPQTLEDFRNYMADMLTGDALAVTEDSRRLAREVLHPKDVGILPGASARLLRFVTAGLLPPRFRRAYGFSWGTGRQLTLDVISSTTRILRPIAPAWVWQSPMLGAGLPRLMLGVHSMRILK